jgi:membrane protein
VGAADVEGGGRPDRPAPRPGFLAALGRQVAKLVRTLAGAVDGFFADRCAQHAAAIAYRVLFSLAPLAIVLVSAAGIVLRDPSVRSDVVNRIVEVLPVSPAGRDDVEKALVALSSRVGLLGLLSLIAFAWTATGMMTAIRTGLAAAMRSDRRRPLVRGKLVDIALVMCTGVLLVAVVVASAVGDVAQRRLNDLLDRLGFDVAGLLGLVRTGVTLLVVTGLVLLLYRFVPARRISTTDALIGALVTSVLAFGLSIASSWVYRQTSELTVIYGSLTTIFVFLYAVYLHACALLLGAEVAAGWSRPPGPPGERLTVRLLQATVGDVPWRRR